ncbi:hypothetical protein V4U86_06370 [Mycobacterium sp. AMU20-3851]|uniref:hypothetical protein n=1 Tax=Mycobacterium sp. AMU20-3851 TaxID=3122055 RepID=UPI003753F866
MPEASGARGVEPPRNRLTGYDAGMLVLEGPAVVQFMPRYEVLWDQPQRVDTPTVSGWLHLPVRVLG